MAKYEEAGAKAAGTYDDEFRKIIENDPDIQAVIRRVWGDTPVSARPSDTPKHLEKANDAASKEIARILKAKGIDLPDRTFVNPRSASLEGHRGWSGLSGIQKAAIIAAAGAAGGVGLGAAGAFGGLGGLGGGAGATSGAGLGGAGLGVTTGVPAGLAGVGATGIGAGGTALGLGTAAAGGGGLWGSLGKQLLNKDTIGALGSMASGAARGAEADRLQGVDYGIQRDRLGLDAQAQHERDLQNRAHLELQQKATKDETGKNAFQNAMRTSLALNWKPMTRPEGVANFDFVGKGIGEQGRQGAEAMNREAMIRLLEGEKFTPLPEARPYTLGSPAEMPGSSTTEKLLGILGLGGTAYSGLQNLRRNQGVTV